MEDETSEETGWTDWLGVRWKTKVMRCSCCYRVHYEPCDINHWTAASSYNWSCGRPPSILVCGPLLTIWNIVWRLPHCHLSLVARPHFLWPDAQWPGLVWKWFIFDQYRHGRSNPGCRIVGSSTREELTTAANFQSSCHWLMTSIGWVSVQSGRQLQEGDNTFV